MNIRTLAVVSLSNRDYADFEAKLTEAVQWLEYAKMQGADLVVFPEMLNIYRGDGPGNPLALPFKDAALVDWQAQSASLIRAARDLEVAVAVPLLILEMGRLANVFYLFSKDGRMLGRCEKLHPTPEERAEGMLPGSPALLDWDGVPVAGAICFDTNYSGTFASQAALGAKLFVIPSLWNGGPWLKGLAARYAVPMAVAYPAWSRIIDLDGTTLISGGYRQESLRFGIGAPVFSAKLNFDREVFHLNNQGELLPEIQSRYGPNVRVTLLHEQAAFCIESVSDTVSVPEIMSVYGLTSFRDYLSNAE